MEKFSLDLFDKIHSEIMTKEIWQERLQVLIKF